MIGFNDQMEKSGEEFWLYKFDLNNLEFELFEGKDRHGVLIAVFSLFTVPIV